MIFEYLFRVILDLFFFWDEISFICFVYLGSVNFVYLINPFWKLW